MWLAESFSVLRVAGPGLPTGSPKAFVQALTTKDNADFLFIPTVVGVLPAYVFLKDFETLWIGNRAGSFHRPLWKV